MNSLWKKLRIDHPFIPLFDEHGNFVYKKRFVVVVGGIDRQCVHGDVRQYFSHYNNQIKYFQE